MIAKLLSALAGCLLMVPCGVAQTDLAPPLPGLAPATTTAAPEGPTMREISPGVLQIGPLRVDQNARTVHFPGRLNMKEGLLEYLLVTPDGSTHEALLVTDIQPSDLHFAMLLLGAKGAGLSTPAPEDAPPAQINKEYLQTAPKLKGDEVLISVAWQEGETKKVVAVEDWLANAKTHKAPPRGPWLYTGSMFKEGRFLAQSEGIFGALVTYPSALINNPRAGNDDDSAWEVNTKAVPAVDTPVEISIKLTPPPQPAKTP